MNADIFFTMGSTHKICQDYALCKNDDKPFVILADGCSSAIDSDFGSRLLSKAAAPDVCQYYKHYTKDADLHLFNVIRAAHTFCRTLSLSDDSLCATLMIAKEENKSFRVISVGDGVVAAKHKTQGIQVLEFTFDQGAPYYLRYELDKEIKDGYFQKFGVEDDLHLPIEVVCSKTEYWINPNGEVSNKLVLDSNVKKDKIHFDLEFPLDEFEAVAIMSDGAASFVRQNNTQTSKQNLPVPVSEIVNELLSFKGYTGEFVQRRCQKAFKKFKEQGMQNYDDFSMAVIANV